jgi:hypothetical protein
MSDHVIVGAVYPHFYDPYQYLIGLVDFRFREVESVHSRLSP